MKIKIFSKTKEKGKKDLRYRFKVTIDHINKSSEFLKKIIFKNIIIDILWSHLNKWDELKQISGSGVCYLLTRVIKFSYKKAHHLPKQNAYKLIKKRFLWCSLLTVVNLKSIGIKQIYVDKFHFSTHSFATYNCSLRSHFQYLQLIQIVGLWVLLLLSQSQR